MNAAHFIVTECVHGVSLEEPCRKCESSWVRCGGCGKLFPRSKGVLLSSGAYMPECVPSG